MIELVDPLVCAEIPGVVMMPGVFMVLHLGDPAAVGLGDVSAGDLLVLPAGPGPPAGPPPPACLARLDEVQRLACGVNLKLGGLYRVGYELQGRLAHQVRVLPDTGQVPEALYEALVAFSHQLPGLPAGLPELPARAPAGLWLDILAFHLPLNLATRRGLLAQTDVVQRAAWLLRILEQNWQALTAPPPRHQRLPTN